MNHEPSPTVLRGHTQPGYEAVGAVFAGYLSDGQDVGASCCVTVEGETVVDLWGGHADADRTRPWDRDTIVNVYSTTKTMTALTALLLADRGAIDVDAPVAHYWPEFAAAGKDRVTVAHLLSHTSGLSGWREPLRAEDLYDWEKATALLAAQEPFWEPGTASGYHGLTFGYLVGEVVRRATGRPIGTVFRDELAEPLGADFHIGLPASEDGRVADLIPPAHPDPSAADRTDLQRNAADNPVHDPSITRTRAWRAAGIPAVGGTGNARSIATVHAILANGGVTQGRRYLSEPGARRALEVQSDGRDLILDRPVRFGLGFAVGGLTGPGGLYWGGLGGSLALIDVDRRLSFGYAMNRMAEPTEADTRALGLLMAVLDSVET